MTWDLDKALSFLKTQGIVPMDKVIELGQQDFPGLTAWGAIDFLCHYCGYTRGRRRW